MQSERKRSQTKTQMQSADSRSTSVIDVLRRYKQYFIALALILVFATATRFYRLSQPPTYVFDEVYHAVTAKLYARNDPAGYEWWHSAPEPNTAIEWLHPPLGKLAMAVGILSFGPNSFGWRFSSAVFGVATITAIFFLGWQLTKSIKIGVFAAGLAATDGLLLVQSRIAMNDIHLTLFVVLAILFYSLWKEHRTDKQLLKYFFLSGLSIGLACSSKWTGVYLVGAVGIDTALTAISEFKLPPIKTMARMLIFWLIFPAILYVLSYTQFWLQGHTIGEFIELHKQIWWYETTLTATHQYQSTPVQWIFDLRPVWMYVDYSHPGMIGNIYNLGNPVVILGGFLAMWAVLIALTKRWQPNLALLIIAYMGMWFPWAFSPRIMFFYHYTPAIPFLCVALGWLVAQLMAQKQYWQPAIGYSILGVALLWIVVFYPDLTGIPVPQTFANTVYFAVPSWK
jgi:dolichyl-phosphate-mannose-protein mannosyltransferase